MATPKPKVRADDPTKGVGGRKKWEPDLARIEELAANGLTQEQIAKACGIHPNNFATRKWKDDELRDAITRGQARGIGEVANALFENATKNKNVAAQIFFLKARAKWRDNEVELGMTVDDIAKALIAQAKAAGDTSAD